MKTLFAAMIAGALLSAQPPTNAPISFEVASIKPTKWGSTDTMMRFQRNGHFTATAVPVKLILKEAYEVAESQVSGAPAWLNSENYDIEAKPDESVAAALSKLPFQERKDKFMQLLRSLLAERLKLVLSHETKDLSVYMLTVSSNGPKLKRSTYKTPENLPNSPARSADNNSPRPGVWVTGVGTLTATAADLPMLVTVLTGMAGRIVVDKTGLKGQYDFALQWTPEPGSTGSAVPGFPKTDTDTVPPSDSTSPSLFTALQEQLGLKLESQKAPVDILVIKHVEKPSEN